MSSTQVEGFKNDLIGEWGAGRAAETCGREWRRGNRDPAAHGSWPRRDIRTFLAFLLFLLVAFSPASLKRVAAVFSLVFGVLLFVVVVLLCFLLFLTPMARSVLLAFHSLPFVIPVGTVMPLSFTAWHLASFSTSWPPSSASSSSAYRLPATSGATLAPALDTTQTQADIPSSSAPEPAPAFACNDVLKALTTHNQRLETANRALAIFAGRLMQEHTAWLEQQTEQHEVALAHVHSAQAESDRLRAKLAIVKEALLQRDHQIQSLQTLLNQYQELKGESTHGLALDKSSSAQRQSLAFTAIQQEADECRKSQAIEVTQAWDTAVAAQEEVLPVRQFLMERTSPVKAETKRKGKGWWSWWGSMT